MPACRLIARFADVAQHEKRRNDAERDIDEENAPPAPVFGEGAADEWSQRGAYRGESKDDADRPALPGTRESAGDDRDGNRKNQRRAHALNDPRREQHRRLRKGRRRPRVRKR